MLRRHQAAHLSAAVAPPATPAPSPPLARLAGSRSRVVRRWLLGAADPAPLWREAAVYGVLLTLVAALVYGSHIRHGGFLMDDWSNTAKSRYLASCCWLGKTGQGAGWPAQFHAMLHDGPAGYHLGLPVVVPMAQFVFGVHLGLHLALAVMLGVAMSVSAYAVMRRVGVTPLTAGVICTLAFLFPWSDSLRLWAMASFNQIAPTLWAVGALLAFRGLRATTRRSAVAWHAGALVLYVAAILMYELAGGLVFLGALLYFAVAHWRPAAVRWVVDVAVGLAAELYVLHHTLPRPVAPWDQRFEHVRLLGDQSLTLLSRATVPFGSPQRWVVDAVVVLALAAGVAGWLLARDGGPLRTALRRWSLLGIGGVVVVAAGYLVIVPSTYGGPLDFGIENRVNMIAAFGYVMAIYAAAGVIASFALVRLRRPLRLAVTLPVGVAIVLAGAYIHQTRDRGHLYDSAYAQGQHVLDQIGVAYRQHPPQASVTYAFNFSTFEAPGIPVFAWIWDMPGAMKVRFDDPSLAAFPVMPGTTWHCGKSVVYPNSLYGTGVGENGPYRHAFFVDIPTSRIVRIDNQAACRRYAKQFRPGTVKAGTNCAFIGAGPATHLEWTCPESVWRRAALIPARRSGTA